MRAFDAAQPNPVIVLGAADHARLSGLADALADRQPELADDLMLELERAKIVPSDAVPDDVVRMGSTVTFRLDDGESRRLTLVFPVDADIARDRISVVTPVGVALIGLAAGQAMTWTTRDGRAQRLTVIAVEPPAA
jgi:regulator of nucleoside diphosphate kinase